MQTSTFSATLHQQLDKLHLLNHPFYHAWSAGQLSLDTLQVYAQQYYHHVAAFPRYISALHTQCADLPTRQVLLGNLIEEEQGPDNHPELWLRFAKGIETTRQEVQSAKLLPQTEQLVSGYYALTQDSYAKGLGALYAYERQVPEVAASKIAGLQKFYGITAERALQFFTVHIKADEWHSAECLELINKLSPTDQKLAAAGAVAGATLLWQFLDGMVTACNVQCH